MVCGVENFDNKFKTRKMYVRSDSDRYTPSALNNILVIYTIIMITGYALESCRHYIL